MLLDETASVYGQKFRQEKSTHPFVSQSQLHGAVFTTRLGEHTFPAAPAVSGEQRLDPALHYSALGKSVSNWAASRQCYCLQPLC